MKRNIPNVIKLWWHCLWNMHRSSLLSARPMEICCWDCEYGLEDKEVNNEAKK